MNDTERLDWLLKHSHIRFETMDGCIYPSCRERIDSEIVEHDLLFTHIQNLQDNKTNNTQKT